jgi:hypothetical protein
VALVSAQQTPPTCPAASPSASSKTTSHPTAAQIRALLVTEITPRGDAAKIGALLKCDYQLAFRALTAGDAKVAWYRLHKGHKPVLVASGEHRFTAAGTATIVMKLTAAGRSELQQAGKRLGLLAKGTFTPAHGPAVTAARWFSLTR